jgi:hypothetical protein
MFSMSETSIDRRVDDAWATHLEMLGLSVNGNLNRLTSTPASAFLHRPFRFTLLQTGISQTGLRHLLGSQLQQFCHRH